MTRAMQLLVDLARRGIPVAVDGTTRRPGPMPGLTDRERQRLARWEPRVVSLAIAIADDRAARAVQRHPLVCAARAAFDPQPPGPLVEVAARSSLRQSPPPSGGPVA